MFDMWCPVRELLSTPDGGVIGLDWVEPGNAIYCDVQRRPTVLILPGLTGKLPPYWYNNIIFGNYATSKNCYNIYCRQQ